MKNGTLMSRAVISHDNEKLRTAGVGGAEKGHIKVCSSFGSGLLSQSAVQSLWACLIARKNPAIPEDSKLQRKPKSNSRRVSTPFKSFFFCIYAWCGPQRMNGLRMLIFCEGSEIKDSLPSCLIKAQTGRFET